MDAMRDYTAEAIAAANKIATELKARINDSKMRLNVWTKGDGTARVYTGFRGEYILVYHDGRCETSKARMTWGHVIDEVIAR